MKDENRESVHIGARVLDNQVVKNMLPNIDRIKNFIDDFRKNAQDSIDERQENNRLIYEKYDNFISILGNRGLGKTSIMMTLIKEVNTHNFFASLSENVGKVEYNYDLISPLIVPDDMSDTSDILGWIIVVLEKILEKEINSIQEIYNLDKTDEVFIKNIRGKFLVLKKNYQYRKLDYQKIISDHYDGSSNYIKKSSEVQEQDYQIIDTFHSVIDELIKFKKHINRIHKCNEEPLLFLFFDDVDMTAKNCTSILEQFLTFLSHSHIVVFISGDYDLFCQTVTLKMLKDENLENLNIDYIYSYGKETADYKAISLAKSRSEFFLKKVMPPLYRFEIRLLNNRKKAFLTYNSISDKRGMTIKAMLKKIFPNQNPFFMEYKDKDNMEYTDKDNIVDVYAYYSIFSSNVRGFINVYLYLYNEYYIFEHLEEDERQNKLIDFMENFLSVVIFSKNIYRINQKDIGNYLYFKDEKKNEKDSQIYDKIRIDCEELQVVISNKINKYRSDDTYYLTDEEKDEIEALIMLPVFMNELNLLCNEDDKYKHRHDRVAKKLQNILIYTFTKNFNDNITQLIPYGSCLNETLLYYSFITTRMSMKTISTINGDISYHPNVRDFNENNDKKYLVQLMKCASEVMCVEDKNKKRITRNDYDESCYSDNGREEKETLIMKSFIERYKITDYKWMINLQNMINSNISLISNLYPYKRYYSNSVLKIMNQLIEQVKYVDDLEEREKIKSELKSIERLLEDFTQVFSIDKIRKNVLEESKEKYLQCLLLVIKTFRCEINELISVQQVNDYKYNSISKKFINEENDMENRHEIEYMSIVELIKVLNDYLGNFNDQIKLLIKKMKAK